MVAVAEMTNMPRVASETDKEMVFTLPEFLNGRTLQYHYLSFEDARNLSPAMMVR